MSENLINFFFILETQIEGAITKTKNSWSGSDIHVQDQDLR